MSIQDFYQGLTYQTTGGISTGIGLPGELDTVRNIHIDNVRLAQQYAVFALSQQNAQQSVKKEISFIEELRDEIKAWHGELK